MTDHGHRFRLLLVEDEYLNARYLAELVSGWNIEVLGPVASVDAALALLEAEPPDAALLDVNLQGVPVYPVADRLTALGVPFAFASGYGPAQLPARYRDAPMCLKPVDPHDLEATLARMRMH